MSDKKTLNINLDLFKFSNNKTRKKQSENKDKNIKIRTPVAKKRDDSLKKKSILKMIRQHQEERYSKLFEESTNQRPTNKNDSNIESFNKDFQDAHKFLQNLSEKNENAVNNRTLKQYPENRSNLMSSNIFNSPDIKDASREVVNNIVPNVQPMTIPNLNLKPQYGCLKNGALPTYRNYMNQTRKNPIMSNTSTYSINGGNVNPVHSVIKPETNILETNSNETIIDNSLRKINEMKNAVQNLQDIKKNLKPKRMKRKRTLRRTYKIGRSKIFPKISVLVSNKTIRNNISIKSQMLKSVSIDEVKKYLIKHGFIKIGSDAPNDILRKMYESALLICGDVHNHNPDNLLHNFLNDNN